MTAWSLALEHWLTWMFWGLIASTGMATLLEGAQLLGVSRMSLPFLFGSVFTANRRRAIIIGYVVYISGGWAFALFYALLLGSFANLGVWSLTGLGLVFGTLHGVVLVTLFLSVLPFVHPRLATSYDGPQSLGLIEPPGSFGLNYGRATPVTTIIAQAAYGLILGLGYGLALQGGAA